jgi:hypothetical protein
MDNSINRDDSNDSDEQAESCGEDVLSNQEQFRIYDEELLSNQGRTTISEQDTPTNTPSIELMRLDDSKETTSSKDKYESLSLGLRSNSTEAFDDGTSSNPSIPMSDSSSISSISPKWKRYGNLEINKKLFNKGIVVIETCSSFVSTETYNNTLLDSPVLTCLRNNPAFRKLYSNTKLENIRQVCDEFSFSVGSRTLTFSTKAALIEKGNKTTMKTLNKTVALLNELKKYVVAPIILPGLQYTLIPGDGHCLYNAVALYLGQDVTTLRQEVADYLEDHVENYRDVIEANSSRTIEEYIYDVRNTNEWADDLEINVLMRIYGRPIYVIDPVGNIRNRANEVEVNGEPIFVYYNGHNHYDGLVRIEGFTSEQILESLSISNRQQETTVKSEQDFIIANLTRREEVFFPFLVKNNQQNFGFYVYPWLSTNTANDFQKFNFSGFKRFTTVGCMFGSTLKGIDQLGARVDLIKHDIKFHPTQKIVTIEYSHSYNPYEEVMFNELNKLMLLINHLSDKSKPSQLYYHLPYYDYMLFGIELFIRGRMELVALEQFFKAIILKTVEHLNRIEEICKRHLINCIIGSPFENLFGRLKFQGSDGSDLKLRDIAKIITEDPKKINIFEMILPALGTLGIEPNNELGELDELNPEQKTAQEKVQEKLLVQHCLRKLQDNNFNLRHKQVWNDFIKFSDKEINTLDDLFRTANAIVVLLSCQGEENYKVCSILPFSEKQIQVSYSAFYGKSNGKYPVIVNITTIEPVLSYDHNRQGLLFYYGSCPDSLSRLITEGDILTAAHENIARTVENKESIDIEQVLTMLKKFKL